MAKRETYTTKIACGNCGATGTGTFSENANPVFTRGTLDRHTLSVSDGFTIEGNGPMGIRCGCGSDNVDHTSPKTDWRPEFPRSMVTFPVADIERSKRAAPTQEVGLRLDQRWRLQNI